MRSILSCFAVMLLATAVMHLMGLLDDRKAMGPYSKLVVQLGTTTVLVLCLRELRVLHETPAQREDLARENGVAHARAWPDHRARTIEQVRAHLAAEHRLWTHDVFVRDEASREETARREIEDERARILDHGILHVLDVERRQ